MVWGRGSSIVRRGGAPGVFDTMASPALFVRKLMRELFPTLLRPMTANSGYLAGGHADTDTQLWT